METDVVVIGGGITGLGVARDAAMRGFKVILLERGEIGSGTSGYFHGILHSGARYAVVDPESAKECYQENQILRQIIPTSIVNTSGLFLAIDDQDLEYADLLFKACKKHHIPIEELSVKNVRKDEPDISPNLRRAFSVPDAHIDGVRTIDLHKKALREFNVKILTHSKVTGFLKKNDRIEAVIIKDQSGQTHTIAAQFIINAAGVWAEQIGNLANVKIDVVGDKGAMIVLKKQFSRRLLNRCRMPSDGDQLLPTRDEYIIGTTSMKTSDIDTHKVEQWEVDKLFSEAEVMVPGISKAVITRSYAGVRPLYAPQSKQANGRLDNRSFKIINHKEEGINNFVSVVGGKFILYRLMAEHTVDTMCDNLGIKKVCETAKIPL